MTDQEIDAIASANDMDKTWYENEPHRHWRAFARAIEQAAIKQEREACAKLATDMCEWTGGQGEAATPSPYHIAKAIRARE